MHWVSALESVIQVAIAIAGFSGIVAAVGRRGEGHWTDGDQLLLRILLTATGIALLWGFLPFLLVDLIEPAWAWRIASGLVAIWTTVITIYRRRQAARIPGVFAPNTVLVILPIAVVAALVANACWFASPSIYVFGVLWGLVVAFITFVRLLLGSWRRDPTAPASSSG